VADLGQDMTMSLTVQEGKEKEKMGGEEEDMHM
jgi:hypothetical protein